MKNFLVFTQKEFLEGVRTYKAVIFLVVFMIFGLMNPLMAKLTPELMASLASEGIAITLAEPAAIDSWMQFFKNISQMGLVVMVILFSGILTNEIHKGTLINMLTKGLSRTAVILAKFMYLLVIWTVAYAICLGITAGYTVYLFPESSVDNLAFAAVALWVFGVLLLSLLMLASSCTKSNYLGLLMLACAVAVMGLVGIAPATHDYNPMSLMSDSTALLNGSLDPHTLIPAIILSLVVSLISIIAAVMVFRKRQL